MKGSVAHGFVLQMRRDDDGLAAMPLHVEPSEDGNAIHGPYFSAFARPLATTPEAEHESQPITNSRLVLVYAGRIDNRQEIARRLGKPQLNRVPDGTLLAEAYGAWGGLLGQHVVGEYSFALIDLHTRKLVAARDSLGIGRLFCHETSDAVWVASNLELLLSALSEVPSFDGHALAEYFASGGLLTSGRTIFNGIAEVPAAHVLTHSGAGGHTQRYWQPDPEHRLRLRRVEEYVEHFRSLLIDAVGAALRSATPVWSDLSGGLDSSTVTAIAAQLQEAGEGPRHGLGSFSLIASETAISDESAYQRAFLERYPLAQATVDIDRHLSFSIDEPPSCHPSKAILYRPIWHAAAQLFDAHGVLTHLTGRGGDPVFCADDFPPLFLGDRLRRLELARWWRESRQWARQGTRSFTNLLWHCNRRALTDLYAGVEQGRVPDWLTPRFRQQVRLANSEAWRGGERLYESAARELQYRSVVQTAAIARHITVGDERHPLLYRPLVEFALAIPWDQLVRPAADRVIQRKALKGILPDAVRLRKSKASGTGILLRGIGQHWAKSRRFTEGRRVTELGLVDGAQFRAACERLRHGLVGKELRYFAAALSLEVWLDANAEQRRDSGVQHWIATRRWPEAAESMMSPL